MEKTEAYRRLIAGFLLLLFVAFYANITFFTHIHIIDGVKIAHSHFHNKCHSNSCAHYYGAESSKPPLSGGHSHEDFIFIAKKSTFETLDISPCAFASPFAITICDHTKFFLPEHPEVGFYTSFFLRGPPLVV
ncbi:MAG: hypothetical protein FWC94_07065 [Bacteroidales bacterium]|nr:hypothetical protein [Bacteroidales bacterium]